MKEIEVKLSQEKIDRVVKKLNKVLDDEGIFSEQWISQVVIKLILSNLRLSSILKLIDNLEHTSIRECVDFGGRI